MLHTYLRIAFRNIIKHKSFSFINIFGLALGTACCLYILLYVRDEYSYDRHHADVEHIYRITSKLKGGNELNHMATCSPPIPMAMKRDFPEVEEAMRFVGHMGSSQQLFRYGGKVFYAADGIFADSTFFRIFTYRFLHGHPERALSAPYSIVLSEAMARMIFGSDDPVGKTLEMDTGDGRRQFTVTGVVNDELGKSHIKANYLLSMNSGGIGEYALQSDEWSGNNFTNAYVKLRPNTSAEHLESKLPAFLQKYGSEQLQRRQMEKTLLLQPITSIHTSTGHEAEPTKPVSTTLLSILLAIAGLIQLIACINFMNLSTARAAKRAREIGIRKVVGAQRRLLIGQFLSESLVIAFFAMIIAVPLVNLLLPTLNQMTGVNLSSNFLLDKEVWLGILVLGLLTGLLAGSYPAFYLSGIQPLKVLKGRIVNLQGSISMRQALVVFQFVLAIALVASVLIIRKQFVYIQQQDLGYEPEQKIVVPFRSADALQHANSYRDAIRQLPEVRSVSRANNYLSQFVFNDLFLYKQGQSMKESVDIRFMRVDEFFMETLDIELLRGRNFQPTDTTGGVIVNEATLRLLDIPADQAVGKHLYSDMQDGLLDWQIIGVMNDFNFSSLYSEITPFLLAYSNDENHPQMIISAETEDYGQLISQLEAGWNTQIPSVPFEYTFIDEEVQKQYEADRRLSHIINIFTLLTILILCLGLLGLAMFTAERRTKEIGIRKVLGASAAGIVGLLSRDFLRPVLIALVIAAPLAWYLMNRWLANFAYRTDMPWWVFALAGLAAIAITLLTVSFQSIKAALANPMKALRSE